MWSTLVRRIGWGLLFAAVAWGAFYVLCRLFPWSPINCRHEDVDIRTGRVRYTRYLLGARVSQRVADSVLTQALPPEAVAGVTPEWRRVNTFSPGVRHSPHYAYHGALHTVRLVQGAWGTVDFTDAARRQVAETVLRLWQEDGDYFAAGDYAFRVVEAAIRAADEGREPIAPDDLPPARTAQQEEGGTAP